MRAATWAQKQKRRVYVRDLDIPPEGELLWDWFHSIDAARQFADGGWQATTNVEIAAWRDLHGWTIHPWEVEVLRAMDLARLAVYNTKAAGPDEPSNFIPIDDSRAIGALLRSVYRGE